MDDSCIAEEVGLDIICFALFEESLVPPPRGNSATVDAMAVLAAREEGRFRGDKIAHVGLAVEKSKERKMIARMESREKALRLGGWVEKFMLVKVGAVWLFVCVVVRCFWRETSVSSLERSPKSQLLRDERYGQQKVESIFKGTPCWNGVCVTVVIHYALSFLCNVLRFAWTCTVDAESRTEVH